jgi:flagellin-specific chaperone FliS
MKNNNLNEYLDFLRKEYSFNIENVSDKDILLFNIPYTQPFKFNMKILFYGIVDKEHFYINIHSLNIKRKDIDNFKKEIDKITDITKNLNSLLNKYKFETKAKIDINNLTLTDIGEYIEQLDINVCEEDMEQFQEVLDKYFKQINPDNELTILECVEKMPERMARKLLDELMQFSYKDE